MSRFVGPAVSREHPWPGLMPFTEEAHDFFHGRDAEVAELLRLIRRQPLTVLFGLSGLGKSSLLNAGLFPRLREEDFLPIYIRLDVLSEEPLAAQAMRVIAANAAAHGVEAPGAAPGETPWEYFHRRDADFWSARNRLLTPVLVFDQFEELFTLGRHSAQVARRCRAFLEALADLVEGRPPAEVIALLEKDPARGERLDFSRATYKVLLSFREDYLADFEGLRGAMPSIMKGRLRLARMNGSQARAAILESGGHLVSEGVADRIIRFVASSRGRGEEAELERLEIEPALLSVVCRELNNKRIAMGLAHISADLLEGGAQQEIIREFYEESLADLDPRIAEFIEDQLLTEAGYRDSYALEDALALPGITREAIDTLIARRLVRLDERAGVLRVELTHDVLTKVAKASRDRRKEREARRLAEQAEAARRRRVRGLLAVGAVVVAGSIALATTFALLLERSNEEKRRLVETQSNVLLEQSIGQLERNVPSEPQAILAEAMRLNPANGAAVARAVTYLSHRSFGRETAERRLEAPPGGVDLRARAAFVVTKKPSLGVVDLETGAALAPERDVARAPAAMAIAADRSRIAWEVADGKVAVARLPRGDATTIELDGPDAASPIQAIALSPEGGVLLLRTARGPRLFLLDPAPRAVSLPDPAIPEATADSPIALGPRGEWVAFGGRRGATAWNRATLRTLSFPHPSPVNALEFSGDGAYLVTGSQDKNARIWELQSARLVGSPFPHEGAVLSASYEAPGEQLVTGSLDRTARIWNVRTAAPLVEPLVGATPVVQARVRDGGKGAATFDASGRLALWEVVPAEAPAPLAAAEGAAATIEASADGRWVAVVAPQGVRVLEASGTGLAPRWSRASAAGAATRLARIGGGSRWVAIGLADGSVELRGLEAGTVARTLRLPRVARLVEFSADGRSLAVATEDDVVRLWDVETGSARGLPMEASARLDRLQFSPDGRALLGLAGDGRVQLWDARNSLALGAVEPEAPGRRVAFAGFTGRGWELVVVEERLARLMELTQPAAGGYALETRARLAFLNTAWSADVAPGMRRLVVGSLDGTARLVELETFRLTGSAMKHDGVVVGAGFSPEGRWVVTRTAQSARVWDARTGFPVSDAWRHENGVAGATLLGGGAYLFTQEANVAPLVRRLHLDFPDPRPAWLPALVEVAGRGRFDRSGGVAPIDDPRREIAALREAVARDSPSPWWKDWGAAVLARLDARKAAGP